MFLVAGLGIAIFIATIFQCSPVAYEWDKTKPGGKCVDQLAFDRWLSLPNILIDVMMLAVPLPLVWTLRISSGNKIGLTMLFVVGSM